MGELWSWFRHLDEHLAKVTTDYGAWTYVILFVIVFCETGLIVTPFLPGDSLLFAAGAIASLGTLNPWLLGVLLFMAAVLGDAVNYHIGRFVGPRVLRGEESWLWNKKHLERTHAFFEHYGGKAIILARFVPIIRTFAPFVAGVGTMRYRRFLLYNVTGALVWVGGFVTLGYIFGSHPWVKKNFSLVTLGIIVVSLLPAVWEIARHRWASRSAS
ncbi:MAG: DedA family protein [Planctomycetota bacterium]